MTLLQENLNTFKRNDTSQFGENGIIDKIFEVIGVSENPYCVEFGGYHISSLSNIYPLWAEKGWQGLMIEGDKIRHDIIEHDYLALKAEGKCRGSFSLELAFIAKKGTNSLDNILKRHHAPQNLDLMSIDVDGLDYAIWESLELHRPRVVVIEFNPTIPPHITVEVDENLNHIGRGVGDILKLGNAKGYDLVACTEVNAIFVQKEESSAFSFKNDLDALFDGKCLTYAISTYAGGLFLTQKPVYNLNVFTKEYQAIKNSDDFYMLPPFTGFLKMYVKQLLRPIFGSKRWIYK